ncbi:uncharacterized protein LOC143878122 [Tasmannia lanceolata]|uniref:uncharacterized protein LOC143878122 n=1 Tax=Tasmannia lanceolata TaxID=3420 RepID=UPI0040648CFF
MALFTRSIKWHFSLREKPAKTIAEEEIWLCNNSKGKSRHATAFRTAFCATVYFTWRERNTRVFESRKRHKTEILHDIINSIRTKTLYLKLDGSQNDLELNLSKNFQLPEFRIIKNQEYCSWIPPNKGNWKLNTDASLADDHAVIGGIIRADNRSIISAFSLPRSAKSIHALELEAIQQGISLAHKYGAVDLWVESDSSVAVFGAITGEFRCPWILIPTVYKIRTLLQGFNHWTISHTWREANGAADYLSKNSCHVKGEDIPCSSIPDDLWDIFHSDSQTMLALNSKIRCIPGSMFPSCLAFEPLSL